MTKQCPHAVGKTGCSQDAQEPCPKGYFNCKKVVKDKVVRAWARLGASGRYMVAFADKSYSKNYPCAIHIKAADYEKLRKNK